MIEYREYPPPPDLADAVRCIWFLTATSGAAKPQRILPDGCVELVFNFGDRFEDLGCGIARTQPAQLVVGPLSRHMMIRPTGAVDVAGVRFHPGGATAFFAGRLAELGNRSMALDEASHRFDPALWDRAVEARDRRARHDVLLAGLRRACRPAALDTRVAAACRLLAASGGQLDIDGLADATGTTLRTLERLFGRQVGVPPKRLARLERFQSVLRRTGKNGHRHPSLRDAALNAGYFDQAHFLREFRAFAGVYPSTFFGREHNEMSDAFTSCT